MLMLRLVLAVMLNLLSVSQLRADDTTTIAAFGDSLFAGYGLPPEDSFPSQLERRLRADGYKVNVVNDGVSGDTTAGGVSRVDQVVAQKPYLVLVELGGNDLLRGVQPSESQRNLDEIMMRIRKAGMQMVLIGQQAPLTMGAAYANAYNGMFTYLASRYSVMLYPAFLEGVYGHPELMQPDGVHPTKDGVAIMVNNLYPYVTRFLRK